MTDHVLPEIDFNRDKPFAKHRFEQKKVYLICGVEHDFSRVFHAPTDTPAAERGALTEYQFVRQRDLAPNHLSEEDVDRLLALGAIKKQTSGKRTPRAIGPDGPEDAKAPARKWWCERYDEEMPKNSKVALDSFIADMVQKYRDDEEYKSFGFVPSGWSVRRWAQERGVVGERPLEVMDRKDAGVRRHFPAPVEKMMRTLGAWFYASRSRDRIDAYARMQIVIEYLNKRRRRVDPKAECLPLPSPATFYRRIQAQQRRSTTAAKDGEKAAKKWQGVGNAPVAKYPLDIVMIDSTRADTHLVIGEDGLPMGRPTVNFALDICTRVILAVYITFEEANLNVAMSTLKRSMLPKLDIVADRPELKITLSPFGKMKVVWFDNAWAQVGKSCRDACADMDIDLVFVPIETPEAKAFVERAIGTFNRLVFQKAPGGIPYPPNILRKLGLDPRKTRVLTLPELEQRVLDGIHSYHLSKHDGIGDAPIVKWRRMAAINGIDTICDPSHLDRALGEVREASLTREGIKLDGVRYHERQKTSFLLEQLAPLDPLHSKRDTSIRARVKVKRNPADLTEIHVWNHRDKEYVTLRAENANFLTGLSKAQLDAMKTMAKAAKLPFDTDEECAKARVTLIRRLENSSPDLKLAAARKQRLLLAEMPRVLAGGAVRILEAPARHDGMAPPEDEDGPVYVPTQTRQRAGDAKPAKNVRRGGKAATKKAVTSRRNSAALREAEAALANAERAVAAPAVPTNPQVAVDLAPLQSPIRVAASNGPATPPQRPRGGRQAEIMARCSRDGWGLGSVPMKKDDDNA